MAADAFAALMFVCITLALVTGGVLRVVWVILFDEFIGFAKPPEDVPPSRFEVLVGPPQLARLAAAAPGPGVPPALIVGTGTRYRVTGVMTTIDAEVTLRLEANSPAHARQKAEFGGVAVTDVAREV